MNYPVLTQTKYYRDCTCVLISNIDFSDGNRVIILFSKMELCPHLSSILCTDLMLHECLLKGGTFLLTFSRLMTYIYIYMSYRTANLQMLHFIYLFNKYTY